jgi:4'-phosphopantetheinyl transferase
MPVVKSRQRVPWSRISSIPALAPDHVDVWKVRLDEPIPGPEGSILSPDEVDRANRFHFEKDRIHFTHCRSALRLLLSDYLAVHAAEIRFKYLKGGKPQLAVEQNPDTLQFNISHSAGVALIAVGCKHRLGVDIEKIRSEVDTLALAQRFFSVREREGLRAFSDSLRTSAFFACWTRKEAFLKATGDGLSFSLSDFSVTTHPDHDPTVEDIKGNKNAGTKWSLADIFVGDGYCAALAVEANATRIETYAWN